MKIPSVSARIGNVVLGTWLLVAQVSKAMDGEIHAGGENGDAALEVLDEVLVTGERSGPALWQVRSGDHVLWILAKPQLTPQKISWRSRQVADVLKDAREVIATRVRYDPQTDSERRALALFSGGRHLPTGQTLRELLTPEQFAQFEVVAQMFARNDRQIGRLTPAHATNALLNRAARALQIEAYNDPVSDEVSKMGKRRRVKVTYVNTLEGGDTFAVGLERSLMSTCALRSLLRQLEDGGAGWKALANAWSVGDVTRLKQLVPHYGRVSTTAPIECGDSTESDRETSIRAEAASAWQTRMLLEAIQQALERNSSTLAVVDVSHLLAENGLLAALRDRGYEVLEPR